MVLAPEDELDLVAQYRAGNQRALEHLLDEHAVRMRHLAQKHRRPGLDLEDLLQEARLAFLAALRLFDPTRGTRLWTYAQPTVRGHLIGFSSRWLGLDDRGRKSYRRVVAARHWLVQQNHHEPTAREIAAASGVDLATVQRVLLASQSPALPLLEERDPDGLDPGDHRPGLVLPDPSPGPLARLLAADTIGDAISQTIAAALGPGHAPKFLAVWILREYDHYGLDWSQIAALLAAANCSLHPSWSDVIEADYPHVTAVPHHWPTVLDLFRVPPPHLTAEALRQWYSRARRALDGPTGRPALETCDD